MAPDPVAFREAADDFFAHLDQANGFFHDCLWGFHHLREDILRAQALLTAPQVSGEGSADDLSLLPLMYGLGHPDTHPIIEHEATQGEVLHRLGPGGPSQRLIGQMCVVLIFSLWEDRFRARIARSMGRPKNALELPVMGDVRLLRNDVVHHDGKMTRRTAKRLQVLNRVIPVNEGQDIEVEATPIVREIARALDDLAVEVLSVNPGYCARLSRRL
jgi:hypothetical protein